MEIKKFIRTAMLAALAMVLTMVPQIPTGTGGYVHFGDSVIYLAAMLLGPAGGAVVGAVGHSLADLLFGHAIFILPTFVIKGLMGFVIGKLIYPAENLNKRRFICAGLSELVIVTLGYFVAEIPLYGVQTAAVALVSSPVQWLMSVIASAVLLPIAQKLRTKFGW